MDEINFFSLAALFFFTMASFGFLYFMIRYPRHSEVRLWGIRLCHAAGFAGVLFLRLWRGSFDQVSLLIVSSLLVSVLTFELSMWSLRRN